MVEHHKRRFSPSMKQAEEEAQVAGIKTGQRLKVVREETEHKTDHGSYTQRTYSLVAVKADGTAQVLVDKRPQLTQVVRYLRRLSGDTTPVPRRPRPHKNNVVHKNSVPSKKAPVGVGLLSRIASLESRVHDLEALLGDTRS